MFDYEYNPTQDDSEFCLPVNHAFDGPKGYHHPYHLVALRVWDPVCCVYDNSGLTTSACWLV